MSFKNNVTTTTAHINSCNKSIQAEGAAGVVRHRRRRRSKRRYIFSKLSLSLVLFFQMLQIPVDYVYSNNNNNNNNNSMLFMTNGSPKFGERLLPLQRKKANNLNKAVSIFSAKYNNNNNNNNNNSRNINHKKQQQQQQYSTTTFAFDEYETLLAASAASAPAALPANDDFIVLSEPHTNLVNVSKADRLKMSTEFFVVPTNSGIFTVPAITHKPPSTSTAPPQPAHVANVATSAPYYHPPSSATVGISNSGSLRKEPWVVPVLVLSALTMLMMGAFEIFVLFKAWRTSPSRRHLFLGQMLLLGLFSCAGLAAIITAQPTLLTCGTLRFGVGVAYALVFAALLVKCVFLISLNGGVYLPAPYQGLLLLFAVLIQVAIGTQWLLTQPPELYMLHVPATNIFNEHGVLTSSSYTLPKPSNITLDLTNTSSSSSTATTVSLVPLCKAQFSQLLFSLSYIFFLIVFVAVLATKSRGIRDNYREATYIGLAIGGAIPIWCGWMLCGLAVSERHKDACVAFGLVATSVSVFLVMFMPKGRQLAAMGKEGLYVEDREEQFSSLSRAGSGYSPSFFHFKPIKYGMMSGGCTTGNTGATLHHNSSGNNNNNNNVNGSINGPRNKHSTAANCNGNEALPSYTRMYHYFPTHFSLHPFTLYPQAAPMPPLSPTPPVPISPMPPPPLAKLPLTTSQNAPIPPLPPPPTLKQFGQSLTSMTHAHIAQTLRYPGVFVRPNDNNLYTTLEPTLSSNPNVYFQRGGAVHPGMMY